MNATIEAIQQKCLNDQVITVNEVKACQESVSNDEELCLVYWIMSRYYLNHDNTDALVYCCLKAKELIERNHYAFDFKINDFIEARTDFFDEEITRIRTKILPLSVLFGVITLILIWFIMDGGFIIGFIGMNVVSIAFQQVGFTKTVEKYRAKQLAAVFEFLTQEDQQFVNQH